ncbi:retroviral-like aspartic protease family protein [Asticcacaulis sp. W401b]|uniref:retroviral-like aspartic protease family protein n=1 Tax=Asticcacaulis sp. W401b TaxID=3388666 RepID=UPI003970D291
MITRRHLCAGSAAAGLGLGVGSAAAQAKIIRVPLTLSSSKKPIVEVTLNGKGPYRFILDTGASHTVIRASLASELGLAVAGQGRNRSLKGTEYTTRYIVSDVTVGGQLGLHDWEVFASKGFEAAEYDGLLSADLLTRLPCQLDQTGGEIRYYLGGDMPLEGFAPLDSYYKRDITGGADKVHIRLRFAGHELDCLLDTGASRPLYIRGDFVRKHGLWETYPLLNESALTGVNGQQVKVRHVEVRDLQIGGIAVPRLLVALGDPHDRAAFGEEGDRAEGIVGAPFLSGFVLAFTAQRSLQVRRVTR